MAVAIDNNEFLREEQIRGTTYHKGPWVDRYGHSHPATEVIRYPYIKEEVTSHPQGLPASAKFFKGFKVETGWDKNQSQEIRRSMVIKAFKGDYLGAARHLQELANLSTDPMTKRMAKLDAEYFYSMYRGGAGPRFVGHHRAYTKSPWTDKYGHRHSSVSVPAN